jgi:hypothetical protein
VILTSDILRAALDYDPASGLFHWKIRPAHRVQAGDLAGTPKGNGYLKICVYSRNYLAHRMAWLHVTGAWPVAQIDHKNLIRSDNRWSNLREATNTINNQNKIRALSNNKSGLLGVSKYNNKFGARIVVDGNQRNLGLFATAELAHAAYVAAKREWHEGCTL